MFGYVFGFGEENTALDKKIESMHVETAEVFDETAVPDVGREHIVTHERIGERYQKELKVRPVPT